MRIALFITCYNDLLFPEVGQAMVRLLRRLGHEVEFPAEQTCCGQMHFNSGYQDACIPLVERFTDVFAGYDVVVTPSGSCAAMVRHHHGIVAGLAAGRGLAERVATVAPRVLELSEFLVDILGVTDVGRPVPAHRRVPPDLPLDPPARRRRPADPAARRGRRARRSSTCRDPRRAAGSAARSRSRTRTPRWRWGSTRSTTSSGSGAEVLTAGDTSCLMHIGGLLSRQRSPVRVMHLAEILAATEGRA